MVLLLPIPQFVVLLLYLLLLRATALSFSGFASVPVIREDLVVKRAVLTDEQLNSAIALSQRLPDRWAIRRGGRLLRDWMERSAGGALALAFPALLAIPILRAVRRQRDIQVQGACAAIVIASCVLMAATSVRLAPEAAPTVSFAALSAVGFVALASGRIPPVIVILVAACLGPLLAH